VAKSVRILVQLLDQKDREIRTAKAPGFYPRAWANGEEQHLTLQLREKDIPNPGEQIDLTLQLVSLDFVELMPSAPPMEDQALPGLPQDAAWAALESAGCEAIAFERVPRGQYCTDESPDRDFGWLAVGASACLDDVLAECWLSSVPTATALR